MNLSKLIADDRLIPLYQTDEHGKEWVVGYKRRLNSRKAGESYKLKQKFESRRTGYRIEKQMRIEDWEALHDEWRGRIGLPPFPRAGKLKERSE